MGSDQPQAKPKCERFWTLPAPARVAGWCPGQNLAGHVGHSRRRESLSSRAALLLAGDNLGCSGLHRLNVTVKEPARRARRGVCGQEEGANS